MLDGERVKNARLPPRDKVLSSLRPARILEHHKLYHQKSYFEEYKPMRARGADVSSYVKMPASLDTWANNAERATVTLSRMVGVVMMLMRMAMKPFRVIGVATMLAAESPLPVVHAYMPTEDDFDIETEDDLDGQEGELEADLETSDEEPETDNEALSSDYDVEDDVDDDE
eukprot:GHVU01077424.1.p1 GENE.GHVU01077424.1~~GHVU01077424.1.p1  ORF type:complete len:171 (+),score=35.90 GHVU01077424.1:199-711(+)